MSMVDRQRLSVDVAAALEPVSACFSRHTLPLVARGALDDAAIPTTANAKGEIINNKFS